MRSPNCPRCQSQLSSSDPGDWWCARCNALLSQMIVRDKLVLLVNLDHVPGKQIVEVIGMVAGVDVHGSDVFNLSIQTTLDSLVQASARLVTSAYLLGANAVVGTQLVAHHDKSNSVTMVGTAVVVQ